LNEKLKKELKRIEEIFENILKNIYELVKEALENQERRRNSKLRWTDEIKVKEKISKKKKRHYIWNGWNLKSEEDLKYISEELKYIRKKTESGESQKPKKVRYGIRNAKIYISENEVQKHGNS